MHQISQLSPLSFSWIFLMYATLFLYPCVSLSVYGRNARLARAAVCHNGLPLTRLYSLHAYRGHGFPLTLWLRHPCLPDGCWRCGDCRPLLANCSSRCALPGQGYVTVPSVRRGAEPSGGVGVRGPRVRSNPWHA